MIEVKLASVTVAQYLGGAVLTGNDDEAASCEVEGIVIVSIFYGTRCLGMNEFDVVQGNMGSERTLSCLLVNKIAGYRACSIGIDVSSIDVERCQCQRRKRQ